ncbi:Metastasis suppressor protein 1 [Dirofilaria immitis]|nr:Metastasis suppressor protein 1 [Dirofilaria immitis]
MDCDAEFNALVSMYQSVVHDMKLTYPAWENVVQKALKLASQMKSTLICMNAFIDAIQTVGDIANNLKGATRDIGACLTRVCMRQRSIENHMRGFVDSLTDELAMSLQNKGSHWKQRTMEMDRHANKFCRKIRSRKGGIDLSIVNEQRRISQALLTEQRNQMSFLSQLCFLFFQLGLLDESNHLRQVIDHLHVTVRSGKATTIIDTILNDIHQGSDNSWRNCLSSNANRSFCTYNGDDIAIRAPSPTPSTCTWPTAVADFTPSANASIRAHTISVVEQPRRTMLNSRTYTPPSPSQPLEFALKNHLYREKLSLPPIPSLLFQIIMGHLLELIRIVEALHHKGAPLSSSSADVSKESILRRSVRPLSFACEDVPAHPNEISVITRNGHVNNGSGAENNANDQAKVNATLIAETIEQIDKLGSELDSYCNTTSVSMTHQTIRLRSGSCKPPPPPERRNSTITAATPTAPSVAEIRAAGGTTGSSDYASSIASSGEFGRDQFSMRYV